MICPIYRVSLPDPIVIFSSGQSNMLNITAYSWSPAPNLKVWNFDASSQASTEVGTAYVAVDPTKVGPVLVAAHLIALKNPHIPVYVINVARGGLALINWSSTPPPDPGYNFRQAIDGNVPVALAAAGVSKIDHFIWGGCESDVSIGSQTIVNDFESYLMSWLKSKAWFVGATTYVMAMSPYAEVVLGGGNYAWKRGNNALRQCVAASPSDRVWIDLDNFPITLFEPVGYYPYIHRTGEGYYQSGLKLGRSIMNGNSEPISRLDNISGEFTPAASSLVNCSAVVPALSSWYRVANRIQVIVRGTMTVTTPGVMAGFNLTVPVKAVGYPSMVVGHVNTSVGDGGSVVEAPVTQTVKALLYPRTSGSLDFTCTFHYKVSAGDALPNIP